ncbi:glycosyltransferase family 2 protein [Paenibacillus sp. FSL W8-0426]|uniref:glycosyltransferase family 2 protein n=1 Tax=Paenibacillus sp. FSL W8-0426 TaxID=2921714 RepID=UPI0030D89607
MKISVVTTMYRSSAYLPEFYARIKENVAKLGLSYEIIMVNDGSPDNSLDVAVGIQQQDPCVKVIDLSKNFGHHKAILSGLSYARGDLIFLLDCDLEEEPENLELFYNEWLQGNGEFDVIFGVQREREGTFYRRIAGDLFYKFFNLISDEKIPKNPCTIRLMTKRYVSSLLEFKDQNVFLAAMFEKVGYRQKPFAIKKTYKGSSSYNLIRKLTLMMDGVTSFSSRPLLLIMASGSLIAFLSLVYALFLVFRKVFFQSVISGWTSVMVSIWLMSGLIIFSVGVVGVYVSKIFNETKDRPISVVRKVYEQGSETRNS